MSKKITLTRKRLVEEKVVAVVSAADPKDAIAACHDLLEGHEIDWKYNKTLETSNERITISEMEADSGKTKR